MLRLTVLLCVSIYVTLLIAGKDSGQMRPGLAAAVAEGRDIVVLERRRAPVEKPAVVETAAAIITPKADAPNLVDAAFVPEATLATPVVATRKVIAEPIFTLSALPTVTRDEMVVETAADTGEAVEDAAPVSADGQVWYVSANSVNVRQGPSTDTSVLAKLTRGEAVTVSYLEGDEWARISIEGDGLDGYVAVRFLSASAP